MWSGPCCWCDGRDMTAIMWTRWVLVWSGPCCLCGARHDGHHVDEGGTGLECVLLLVWCQRHDRHHVDEGGTGLEWVLLLVWCQRHDNHHVVEGGTGLECVLLLVGARDTTVIMWTRGILVWSGPCC